MRRLIILLLIGSVVLTSGCYSFRKKFIRKKKENEETPVYVDFKDYPVKPSRDAYLNYYLFVRGWLDELTTTLQKGESVKRAKRAINQAIMNVEQIISFYNTEGKDTLYLLYEEMVEIRKDIEKAPNMSESKRNNVVRKIEYIQRTFSAKFNYTDAQKWIE